MTFTLIDPRDLLTADWLTAIGTVTTGALATYAAFQATAIARAEHERAKASTDAAAKAFCVRVAQPLWLAGNAFGEGGQMILDSQGDGARTRASVETLRYAVGKGADLSLVKASPELVAMLPGRLPMGLNGLLTEVEAWPDVLDQLLGSHVDYDPEHGLPRGFQPEGVREAEKIARLALGTAGKLHGCLGLMEEFVGGGLCPDFEKRWPKR